MITLAHNTHVYVPLLILEYPHSSLNGLLEQHGPFRPDANGNLQPNDATWTSIANM